MNDLRDYKSNSDLRLIDSLPIGKLPKTRRSNYRSHWRTLVVGSRLSRRSRTRLQNAKNLVKKLKMQNLKQLDLSDDFNDNEDDCGDKSDSETGFKKLKMTSNKGELTKEIDSGGCSNDSDDPDLDSNYLESNEFLRQLRISKGEENEEFEKDSGCDDWDMCKLNCDQDQGRARPN